MFFQVFGRHTASDRMVSGAYKSEYGQHDDIDMVMKRVEVGQDHLTLTLCAFI